MSRRSDTSKAAIAAEAWGVVLEVAMGQRDRFLAALSEFGLTPGDLRALTALDPHHSRPMGSLAAAWDCDASNVTWMIDRLEQRGLVERRTHPTDRRAKRSPSPHSACRPRPTCSPGCTNPPPTSSPSTAKPAHATHRAGQAACLTTSRTPTRRHRQDRAPRHVTRI
jgi:MarR family